jgi:hypothetical protein
MLAAVVSNINDCYINRIADGLGVDPEDWMTLPLEEWKRRKTSSTEWREALR